MTLRAAGWWFVLTALPVVLPAASDPIVGAWALTLPGGEAGWLAVRAERGGVAADLMWAVGSPRPVEGVALRDGTLSFVRSIRRPLAPKTEKPVRYRIALRAEGDRLRGTIQAEPAGPPAEITGKRQPPLPPRPDLSRVRFGPPVALCNGRDLAGWRVSHPRKQNGWSVRDGILCNDTPKTDFGAYGEYANLRTEAEFEDFQLHVEFRLPPGAGGNSGIYLRGLYEVQVTHRDSRMQGINGPGAVFGRLTPRRNAGRPAGDWETYELTLVDRHITVVHNGETVIDNQPIESCTGGALHSDVTRPGPILLQGDHTSVQYRNFVLRPVLAGAHR